MSATVAETKLTSLFSLSSRTTDCSGFFTDVSQPLHVEPTVIPTGGGSGADRVIDFIRNHENIWQKIGSGNANGASAADFASKGYLVVALLRSDEHQRHHTSGHVAFVLPPPLLGGYPRIVCGSNAGYVSNGNRSVYVQGQQDQSVWGPHDAPKVQYYRTVNLVPELSPSGP